MAKRENGRAPNLRSSIYRSDSDGLWHGWVTMGVKPDGRPDRRHRKAKTEAEVTEKVRRLESDRAEGLRPATGRGLTVEQWLTEWLTTIAPRRVSQHTIDSTYGPKVRRMARGLGAHRLKDLEPRHLDAYYLELEREDGLRPNTVLQHHRILSRALKVAKQRQKIRENPAELVDAPTGEIIEIEPLDYKAALRILTVCERRRNGARWSVALALGVRQAEALGMRWEKLHAVCDECGHTTELMKVAPDSVCDVCRRRAWRYELEAAWQIRQEPYRHGCEDIATCTGDRHRRPCPRHCPGHHRATCASDCAVKTHQCPDVKRPCPADCRGHGRECPERTGGDWRFLRRKGVRPGRGRADVVLALPRQLVHQLRAQHTAQTAERLQAGGEWKDYGLVFANTDGRPVNARSDYDDWHKVCQAAGVPKARVHDARHTAATLLLAQGVDVRTVQHALGHSSLSQTQRYAHVTEQMGQDAAERMGEALWRRSKV
ncbi:tyrosine-type recombinase/integrase [Nocardiopsis lucentensis]|uniref:tyrosine-type recombinase/integrase n=1 Tax=Nocardiopsis lucentensis TaxID=53441 RepID=UPI00034760FB|nr:tyrosine-type recombinase/integrase [Nocardiopsis lucentensis]